MEQSWNISTPEKVAPTEKQQVLEEYAQTLGLTSHVTELYDNDLFAEIHGTIKFQYNNGSHTEYIEYEITASDTPETITNAIVKKMDKSPLDIKNASFSLDLEATTKATGELVDMGYKHFSKLTDDVGIMDGRTSPEQD